MNDSSCIFEIIYSTLLQSHNTIYTETLCETAGVSQNSYYAWLKATPYRALKRQQDRDNFESILTTFKIRGYSKGAKGFYMALLHMMPPVFMNLKKIQRLMEKFNLSCPYRKPNPYRRITKALKTSNYCRQPTSTGIRGIRVKNCPADRQLLSIYCSGCLYQADTVVRTQSINDTVH